MQAITFTKKARSDTNDSNLKFHSNYFPQLTSEVPHQKRIIVSDHRSVPKKGNAVLAKIVYGCGVVCRMSDRS